MFTRVSDDIKAAMKSQDKERLDVLRMLKSKLLENKTSKNPIAEQDVVIAYSKSLQDALALFPEASEQRQKLMKEISYLAAYMPQPVSEAEVKTLIAQIINSLENPAFGLVMKALSPQIKGRFDGQKAADLVKAAFAEQ